MLDTAQVSLVAVCSRTEGPCADTSGPGPVSAAHSPDLAQGITRSAGIPLCSEAGMST